MALCISKELACLELTAACNLNIDPKQRNGSEKDFRWSGYSKETAQWWSGKHCRLKARRSQVLCHLIARIS